MRLGLTTAAFYGRLETEEAAARLRALDVDCAEVFLQTPSEYSAAGWNPRHERPSARHGV